MSRALIVQYGDFHHECIGTAVEYLLRQTPAPTTIDILLPETYPFANDWILFFQRNYQNVIPLTVVQAVSTEYERIFYLTGWQAVHYPHPALLESYGLAHVKEHIAKLPNHRNLCLSPLVVGEVELIPYHFRFLRQEEVPDLFPDVQYFINSDFTQYQILELLCCFERNGQQLLYVNRIGNAIINPQIVNGPRLSVSQLISLYVHKTLICYPAMDSYHLKDRISGSYHLSASFGTRTLMWQPLYQIYQPQIRQHHYRVFPFSSTWELDNYVAGRWLTGLLIEPRELKNVVPLIENFYQVLGNRQIPLHFYCGKGTGQRWRQRLADQYPAISYYELPVNNLTPTEYSDLLKDITLWSRCQSTFLLTIQTDGCLVPTSRWRLEDFAWYDYIGGYAPQRWWWKETNGLHDFEAYQCFNGGFSLRRVEACRQVLTTFLPGKTKPFAEGQPFIYYGEDLYFVCGLLRLGKKVALDEYATNFCSHTILTPGSFCLHKTDIYHGPEYLEQILAYCPEFKHFTRSQETETYHSS